MKTRRILITLLASLTAVSAFAQWQWIDQDGRKVFSDRPPPLSIPDKNIIKRPMGSAPVVPVAAPATPASAASAPKASGVDKELEAKKKQADAEAAAKQKAVEAKNAADKADNCNRARQAKAGLDSGARIATIGADGQRSFMSDDQRAAETQRLQSILQDCN